MDQKYSEFVGVDKVYLADIIQDDDSAYITGTPRYLAPVGEIAGEPEINNTPTYYDNKAGNNYTTEGTTAITLTVPNVPAELMAEIFGKFFDESTGRVYDTGEANPPDKALGFRYNMGKNDYRYFWYNKVNFSAGSEEAATKSNDVDVKTYQLTATAVTTTHEWDIDGKLHSLKRVFGDTANEAFDPAGWFDQVQTPTTAEAPNNLTMTSVPTDNATNVAVGANIVLTFNNKIAAYTATMVKSDFTPVATTNTFDTAKKVLTINPSVDLSATSSYAVILTNVKDIYGQSLADQVINFTTA